MYYDSPWLVHNRGHCLCFKCFQSSLNDADCTSTLQCLAGHTALATPTNLTCTRPANTHPRPAVHSSSTQQYTTPTPDQQYTAVHNTRPRPAVHSSSKPLAAAYTPQEEALQTNARQVCLMMRALHRHICSLDACPAPGACRWAPLGTSGSASTLDA
jgi:hypothetical protein